MNPSSEPSFSLSEGFEAEQVRYRSISKLAVATLALGLLCSTTLLHPMFWLVPVVTLLLFGLALREIARSERVLTGRWCALWGLGLALLLGVAGPAKWAGYRWLIRQEARLIADEWWQHIEADAPEKAYQLTVLPHYRQPRDESIDEYYQKNPEIGDELSDYKKLPLVEKLLKQCREGASIRFQSSEGQLSHGIRDWVSLVYVVTYEEQGEENTFFVRLDLERYRNLRTGGGLWRIDDMVEGPRGGGE